MAFVRGSICGGVPRGRQGPPFGKKQRESRVFSEFRARFLLGFLFLRDLLPPLPSVATPVRPRPTSATPPAHPIPWKRSDSKTRDPAHSDQRPDGHTPSQSARSKTRRYKLRPEEAVYPAFPGRKFCLLKSGGYPVESYGEAFRSWQRAECPHQHPACNPHSLTRPGGGKGREGATTRALVAGALPLATAEDFQGG